MPTFGLIGYPLSHSFSRTYFTEKFAKLSLSDSHRYLNFEIKYIDQFKKILNEYNDLRGVNVTIPHKQAVLPFLDRLDPVAERIGAVNTILVEDGRTTGYNTDVIGFKEDLVAHLRPRPDWTHETRALVLGTGGAALAVHEALRQLSIKSLAVSRTPGPDRITYAEIDHEILTTHRLIINTTPLGMAPKTDSYPDLPYEWLTPAHFCYDLIYNPTRTAFLKRALGGNAGVANGLGMLHGQAEAAWEIWQA